MAVEGGGHRWWWLAVICLVAALAVPFFFVDVPPVEDYPNHLARIFLLAFGGEDPVLSRIYAPDWHLVPDLAVDVIGPPLMHFLPVHVAGRVILALSLLLPVAGTLAYSGAAFRRPNWWALGVGLVAYNAIFLLGFINFLLGVGLALLAAAFWIASRERHPWLAAGSGALATAIIFFAHIFAVLYFALLIGAHELARLWQRRGEAGSGGRLLRATAMIVAALAPAIILYALSPFSGAEGVLAFETPARKAYELFAPFLLYSKALTLLTAVVVLAVVVLLARQARTDVGSAIAFVVLIAAYLVAPRAIKGGNFVDTRLPVMAAFLLFAGFAPRLDGIRTKAIGLLLAVLFAVRIGSIAATWQEHGSDLADFRRVIAPVPPGARVLLVSANPEDDPAYAEREPESRRLPDLARADRHLAALLVIERRAFWPLLFADPAQQAIRVLPPYDRLAVKLGDPPDYRALLADPPAPADLAGAPYLAGWQRNFDYVLVIDAGAASDLAAFLPDRLALVRQADIAALFTVRR